MDWKTIMNKELNNGDRVRFFDSDGEPLDNIHNIYHYFDWENGEHGVQHGSTILSSEYESIGAVIIDRLERDGETYYLVEFHTDGQNDYEGYVRLYFKTKNLKKI